MLVCAYLYAMHQEVVAFHIADTKITLRSRTALKLFLANLCKREGRSVSSLQYIFCSDAYLLPINQQFLQHDEYTDIITFDLSEHRSAPMVGEIYISVDRVRENAKAFQTTFTRELHRVIFHGALHLCGYKDKSKADQATMRQMEELYLKRYGL